MWHDVHEKFLSTQQLKQKLISTFEEKLPPLSELECGYFEKLATGKRWIEDDKELDAMYKGFFFGVRGSLAQAIQGKNQAERREQRRQTMQRNLKVLLNVLLGKWK